MSRRSWIMILVILAFLAITTEIYFRSLDANRAGVQIINQTGSAIEGLEVSFAESRIVVGQLGDGDSTIVRISGTGKGPLSLDYHQVGNPVAGFQIAEFDPVYLNREHFKMVLTIKLDQIERSTEDDESSSMPRSLGFRLFRWIEDDLDAAK